MPVLIGLGAFVAVLVVIGIIGAVVSSGSSKTRTGKASSAAPAAPSSAGAKAPAKKKAVTSAFGSTYTYGNGLAVTVSKLAAYDPTEESAGAHPGDRAVAFTVKITNGTKKTFDTSLVGVNVKAGSQGAAADAIFDDTIDGDFTGTVVAGSSATARFAFDIPKSAKGSSLDTEVEPDSGLYYSSWHWVGSMP